MTRSAHIIASTALGGAESFYLRLLESLNQTDHSALAATRAGSQLSGILSATPHRSFAMGSYWDVATLWQMRRWIAHAHIPIVQTYMSRATWLTRPPKQSTHIARLGGYYKLKYFRHAEHWVGNTRGICRYLVENGFPKERVHYISNFVVPSQTDPTNLSGLSFAPEQRDAHYVILALGRFSQKKGFDALLEAYAQLPTTLAGRQTHLILLGDGVEAESLRQKAQSLGVMGRLSLPGWTTDSGAYMRLADCFICPSRIEPLGNVILEAWAHGLPVVSTRSAGGEELINDGENGVLVDIDDTRAMAQALEVLSESRDFRDQLAGAGSDYLAAHHSEPAITQAYLDLYEKVKK